MQLDVTISLTPCEPLLATVAFDRRYVQRALLRSGDLCSACLRRHQAGIFVDRRHDFDNFAEGSVECIR